jgi:hypothetical protein
MQSNGLSLAQRVISVMGKFENRWYTIHTRHFVHLVPCECGSERSNSIICECVERVARFMNCNEKKTLCRIVEKGSENVLRF